MKKVDLSQYRGEMEEGKYYEVDKGTLQGGILSPLLANIYLHYCLNVWFEKVIQNRSLGFCQLIQMKQGNYSFDNFA